MCEFKVEIGTDIVFNDAIYAKAEGNGVVVKDVLGGFKKFENCIITEVNVNEARLTLSPPRSELNY